MERGTTEQQRVAVVVEDIGIRKYNGGRRFHMHVDNLKEKVRFTLSALLYLLFNLRIGNGTRETLMATGVQILQTAPFVAGLTYFIVAILQYMGDGGAVPWDRRLRLFFAIGIIAGLILAIWEYGGLTLE